jgi:hypothetical protein
VAKYHASPRYKVGAIIFDMHGEYATDQAEEVAQLDALVPKWIAKEPEVKTEEKAPAPETKQAPKPRKSSAK